MTIKFTKTPKCEECGSNPATAFHYFHNSKNWKFCCGCAEDSTYRVDFDRFFSSPASTVDWLAHLDEKNWKNWRSFMEMITRFRTETDSFGAM